MGKTFSISIQLGVVNKLAGPLNKAGTALNKVANKATTATSKLNRLGETLNKVVNKAKKFNDAGKKMTLALSAPILGFAALSLKAFNKQAQAIEQVRVGVEATGGAAGRTLEQLRNQATKLQEDTLFGDETILSGATAQLLTFTNIANKNFDRTQKVVLDVATRLAAAKGGTVDLTATSIMLGKALNDPVANLGALSRSGIQFSKDQKKVIKSLAEGGQLAQAQAIILKELEKQYGGSAKAAAKAGTGPLTQLFNLIGDLTEKIGDLIFKAINPFIEKLKIIVKNAIKWIDLNPGLAKMIALILGVVAAIGPILIGFSLLAKTIGVVVGGFAAFVKVGGFLIGIVSKLSSLIVIMGKVALTALIGIGKAFIALQIAGGPILWIIEALILAGILVYKNWDTVKEVFISLWKWVKKAAGVIGKVFDAVINPFGGEDITATTKNIDVSKIAGKIGDSKSETDINLKVQAEPGTSVLTDKVSRKKGAARVKTQTSGYTGNIVPVAG